MLIRIVDTYTLLEKPVKFCFKGGARDPYLAPQLSIPIVVGEAHRCHVHPP